MLPFSLSFPKNSLCAAGRQSLLRCFAVGLKPMTRLKLFLLLFCFSVFYGSRAQAQPQLPDVIGAAQHGLTLLSWTAQFDGIKSIAVQRSSDSVYNFTTIGYVRNTKKGAQGFIDGHPMPGKNFYRLYIAFSSDLTWFSNRFRVEVDSAQILAAGIIPPNDSLQKLVPRAISALSGLKFDSTTGNVLGTVKLPTLAPVRPEIVPSIYVFTNPFNGHVNIELPDVRAKAYDIRFFDEGEKMVLEIPRVNESPVILDKRNFQRKGYFHFEILRDREQWEKGIIVVQ